MEEVHYYGQLACRGGDVQTLAQRACHDPRVINTDRLSRRYTNSAVRLVRPMPLNLFLITFASSASEFAGLLSSNSICALFP